MYAAHRIRRRRQAELCAVDICDPGCVSNMIESVGRGDLHIEIDLGIEPEGSYHGCVQAELIRPGNSVAAGISPLSRYGRSIGCGIQEQSGGAAYSGAPVTLGRTNAE